MSDWPRPSGFTHIDYKSLRESKGSVEYCARMLGIKPEKILEYESGSKTITGYLEHTLRNIPKEMETING